MLRVVPPIMKVRSFLSINFDGLLNVLELPIESRSLKKNVKGKKNLVRRPCLNLCGPLCSTLCAASAPRGITLNNQYTMLKLFSTFRGRVGAGDPPTKFFNACGLK